MHWQFFRCSLKNRNQSATEQCSATLGTRYSCTLGGAGWLLAGVSWLGGGSWLIEGVTMAATRAMGRLASVGWFRSHRGCGPAAAAAAAAASGLLTVATSSTCQAHGLTTAELDEGYAPRTTNPLAVIRKRPGAAPVAGEKQYTVEEVSAHNRPGDMWVTYRDGVYDVTDFADVSMDCLSWTDCGD